MQSFEFSSLETFMGFVRFHQLSIYFWITLYIPSNKCHPVTSRYRFLRSKGGEFKGQEIEVSYKRNTSGSRGDTRTTAFVAEFVRFPNIPPTVSSDITSSVFRKGGSKVYNLFAICTEHGTDELSPLRSRVVCVWLLRSPIVDLTYETGQLPRAAGT
ncbi:hypothetical protein WN55_06803 [Dufourea novaeangliae]|uniref:Uncharacterized protein n=1 Tax=Dufourea novaeangliae TaxID=178035 RepID=A0A154PR60_DUFNO|nr:hypothetical protein WN55_06803 [Dufourea novaeangliae]